MGEQEQGNSRNKSRVGAELEGSRSRKGAKQEQDKSKARAREEQEQGRDRSRDGAGQKLLVFCQYQSPCI